MSTDCRRRTTEALEKLGYTPCGVSSRCYGAQPLCVRRSIAYWGCVDELLDAHGNLTREQFEYHLRASLKAKVKGVLADMHVEARTEAEAKALAEEEARLREEQRKSKERMEQRRQ